IKLKDASSNFYTIFKSGAVGADVTYILPDGAPQNGKYLTTDATGKLSWGSPAGGSGNTAYGAHASAPTDSLYVDSSGYLGLGTTAPGAKLEIRGTNADELLLQSTATASPNLHFRSGSQDAVLGMTAAGDLRLATETNANALAVTSAGNVGIGTTSP